MPPRDVPPGAAEPRRARVEQSLNVVATTARVERAEAIGDADDEGAAVAAPAHRTCACAASVTGVRRSMSACSGGPRSSRGAS